MNTDLVHSIPKIKSARIREHPRLILVLLTPSVTRQGAPDGFVERGLGFGVLLRADLALLTINLQLEQLFLHRFEQKRITISIWHGRLHEVGEIGGCFAGINCAAARCSCGGSRGLGMSV